MSYTDEYKDCLEYIDSFWDKVTVRPKRRDKLTNLVLRRAQKQIHKNILHVPNSFIVPNTNKFTHVFYWDTFFMFRGLMGTKREWLLKSMVGNFIYLYEKYGIIPNFNSPASTGRSQPPFFTSMILDVYNGMIKAKKGRGVLRKIINEDTNIWLEKAYSAAKKEYFHVWIDNQGFFHHSVPGHLLNRYGDRDIGYAHSSELESGWDFTSRFYNRCDEFLPVDLNVYLFKYERDFFKIETVLGMKNEAKEWREKSIKRKEEINKYMWNESKGFFFDYCYTTQRQSEFFSLAGFTPLWAGLATADQAIKMVKNLKRFESDYGLIITAKESLAPVLDLSNIPVRFRVAIEEFLEPKQWDYPHIWPPLEYLTVIGLLKYGFQEDAARIMKKSLKTQRKIFKEYKTFYEKIDGAAGDIAKSFHYPNQGGFGWTNAVFYRYVKILEYIESGQKLYKSKNEGPPYKLLFIH